MRLYIILDKISKLEYGITDKLWLARLFYIQRYDTNHNLVLIHRKSNRVDRKTLQYNDRSLCYFSGFALLNDEISYIEQMLFDAGIGYFRRKYRRKRYQAILDKVEQSIIDSSIQDCIYRRSDVIDRLSAISEWYYKVGGKL